MATPFGCITMKTNDLLRVNAEDSAILGLIEVLTLTSKNGKTFNIWRSNGLSGYTRLSAGIYASLGAIISIEQRPRERWYTRDDGSIISCDCILWSAGVAEPTEGSVIARVKELNNSAAAKLQADSTTVELPMELPED